MFRRPYHLLFLFAVFGLRGSLFASEPPAERWNPASGRVQESPAEENPSRGRVPPKASASTLGAIATEISWDNDWRFHLGDAPGAEAGAWNDDDWRLLALPHDWSIEAATNPTEPAAGGGGFFPTGIGWYRKHFTAPADWQGKHVWIEFDGVYRNSEVWLNGHSLGRRPSGFASFRYALNSFLIPGGENIIAVRVDNSAQPSSRWYTGSGINRHVRLKISDLEHVEPDSFSITTEQLAAGSAAVKIHATVRNDSAEPAALTFKIVLKDPTGKPVAETIATQRVEAGAAWPVTLDLTVSAPRLWSPASPSLYTVTYQLSRKDAVEPTYSTPEAGSARWNPASGPVGSTRAGENLSGGQVPPNSDASMQLNETDAATITVGLRTVHVSAQNGFELNGAPLKLFGANAHDDNGPLGTAAFDRAEERRAELLKSAGFNSVRTAHNPPSPAFLAACDRLGLLVIEEAFDGWKKKKLAQDYSHDFDEWSQRDLDAMILRDRNHPSVVMWDIGNEPYERGNASGAAIAKKLADRCRELDPTRPVTAGINGLGKSADWSGTDPVFAALDVAGYNYEIAHHAADHVGLPQRVIMVTESYHTETFANWTIVEANPYVIGDFVWSALDYLGEAGIGRVFPSTEPVRPHWEGSHYPWHGAACGDIDLTGERKPLSHYRAIVWDRGEKLYAAVRVPSPDGKPWNVSLWAPPPLLASWTWPGQENHELTVEVYSRHESVRLYLNDHLLGEQPTTRTQEFKAIFTLSYAPGTLRAVGVDAGRDVETFSLITAAPPTRLRLTVDRPALHADGQDLAFVTVEVTDAAGVVVPQSTSAVKYELTGPATLAAIGSADLTSAERYRANPRKTYGGRSLVVIRIQTTGGEITLTATAPGLAPATVTLHSNP